MTVYLTKTMLSKLNKESYHNSNNITNEQVDEDRWEKLALDSNISIRLSRDMICRVCARSGYTPLSYKIYDCDVMGALSSLTNISISADDSLPKYICNECLESVKEAIKLKRNCEISDRKFRNLLNPPGYPSHNSYPYSKHDFQLILHEMKMKRMRNEKKIDKQLKRREKVQQKKDLKTQEFKCSYCNLIFPEKENLVAHRREKQCMRRACDICGQLVRSIAQHMRHNHKQSVLHKCPTCGKEFPIIARLKSHMLVHTDTFNFFCDLCPYKCKHKYYLVMHMRTHTGEKPYKCPQCPSTFVNPSNLNKHKLTHQEKQFKCMLCEKAFRTSAALREHHDATHMNIKHTCNYCARDFCYKSDLRKHEIRNHNRTKRDYIGGEPTYKQVERMQKIEEENMEKWRHQEVVIAQPTQVQTTFIDEAKNYMPTMYFTDVNGMIQTQENPQQQTVHLTLPELLMKKDDVKMYNAQPQGMAFF